MLGLQVTPIQFPLLGNSLPVGILFLMHIAVAEFTLGAITLATFMEWRAVLRGDLLAARYARGATNVYYLMFSFGATLAVFAVVLLFGLWGNEFGTLMNVLLPLIAFAFGLFLVITPLLVVYRNSFQKMAPVPHAVLGSVVAGLQTLFMVLIVGLDAYLITPSHGGLLEAALNPAYFPLLLHRLVGNVSWAALFFAAYAAFKIRNAVDPGERAFQSWAARVNLRIGLITALIMPVVGFVLVLVFSNTQAGYYDNLVAGSNAWMMVLQEAFLAVIFVGGNIALAAEARWSARRRDPVALPAIVISLAGMVVAALPSSVLPSSVEVVRFIGLGVAMLATAVHLVVRRMRTSGVTTAELSESVLPAFRLGRRALFAVGAFAMLTSLLMGVIKETARGNYAVYGELTQAQAQQPFNPPGNLYP